MRRFILAGLLLLGLPAAAPAADLVYVLNSAEASIEVLDGQARQPLRRIPALREVHHLTLTPDGSLLLIGDSAGNEMMFLDPRTGEVKRRERISNPYHLAFTPDGKRLVVTSLRRGQVDIYGWDGSALNFEGRLRVGDMPSHIAFSPDNRFAYVTVQAEKSIAAIDLDKREAVWSLEVGREPAGIYWHAGRLLVGAMGENFVSVVDPEARKVERRITVGRGAHQVFPSPDNSLLYVTSRVDSRITALDAATLGHRRTYDTPGGPDDISFAPDGKLWTTLRWIGRVGVLDPATGEMTTVKVGRSPHGILYYAGAAEAAPSSAANAPAGPAGTIAAASPAAPAPVPPRPGSAAPDQPRRAVPLADARP